MEIISGFTFITSSFSYSGGFLRAKPPIRHRPRYVLVLLVRPAGLALKLGMYSAVSLPLALVGGGG